MRLGELTNPDNVVCWNPSKVTKRTSVTISDHAFQFFLPFHKADRFFEGNNIVLMKPQHNNNINTFYHFLCYLNSRDTLYPFSSPLWLTHDGTIPTCSFFINRLHHFFDHTVGGQSMRVGGATTLVENGSAPSLIQAIGQWSSDSFRIYIWKNPTLIQALLHMHEHSPQLYPVPWPLLPCTFSSLLYFSSPPHIVSSSSLNKKIKIKIKNDNNNPIIKKNQ